MHKNTLWLFVALLVGYLALVYCDETGTEAKQSFSSKDNAMQSTARDLIFEERRVRRRHGFQHLWGWHALAIAYWIKVKLVIVGFFVGSAIIVGLRYIWPNKCSSVVHDSSPIIYDHSPSFQNDHIPYSFDQSSSFGPYSAYSPSSFPDGVEPSSAPSGPSGPHEIKRRSVRQTMHQRRPVATEEQIAEMMFYFLGLDTKACRRRFICEMEFRSRLHPLTSMAFRILGRGFFEKYTNARNELGHAKSFAECAVVNSECVFIEQNEESEHGGQEPEIVENSEVDKNAAANGEEHESEDAESSAENEVNGRKAHKMELKNSANLRAERRFVNLRRRGDRKLEPIAQQILEKVSQH